MCWQGVLTTLPTGRRPKRRSRRASSVSLPGPELIGHHHSGGGRRHDSLREPGHRTGARVQARGESGQQYLRAGSPERRGARPAPLRQGPAEPGRHRRSGCECGTATAPGDIETTGTNRLDDPGVNAVVLNRAMLRARVDERRSRRASAAMLICSPAPEPSHTVASTSQAGLTSSPAPTPWSSPATRPKSYWWAARCISATSSWRKTVRGSGTRCRQLSKSASASRSGTRSAAGTARSGTSSSMVRVYDQGEQRRGYRGDRLRRHRAQAG